MNAADGTARFTPLDADGEPDGATVAVPVSSMKVVNVEPIFDIDGETKPCVDIPCPPMAVPEPGHEECPPLPRVPRPEGLAEFCDLADALFALNDTGGPLHVHLEDHNTELLVGDTARQTITHLTEAIARIEAGDIPAEPTKPVLGVGWPEGHEVHDTAYYYGHPDWADEREQPLEQLRIAIKILTITAPWTEGQSDAAYAYWHRRDGMEPCSCDIYPEFEDA